MTQDDRTPETPEVKSESTPEEAPAEEESSEEQEQTLDNLQKDNKSSKPENIPYDRFKEVNDQLKDSKDVIADLTAKLEAKSEPVTKADATKGLAEIAKEHNLDPDILGKVADQIKAEALAQVQEQLAPITAANKQAQADKVFETMYQNALEKNPAFKDVVNKDVIKQLAFNPSNANKTLPQLLKEVYGNVSKSNGKTETMESSQNGKPEAIESIDYKRAQTDEAYFKQIMADPALKKEYNDMNLQEIASRL